MSGLSPSCPVLPRIRPKEGHPNLEEIQLPPSYYVSLSRYRKLDEILNAVPNSSMTDQLSVIEELGLTIGQAYRILSDEKLAQDTKPLLEVLKEEREIIELGKHSGVKGISLLNTSVRY